MTRYRRGITAALVIAAASYMMFLVFFALPHQVHAADSADTIRKAIDEHTQQINQLNAEIAQYQTQLDATSIKKQTLQTTLDSLNLSIKKVTASTNVTKNQIASTQLEIQQLEGGIADKQTSIQIDEAGLEESLRSLNEVETQSLAAQILTSDTISNAWQDIDDFQTLQGAVRANISELASQKQSLADTKKNRESKEADLEAQKQQLVTQQGSLNATKKAQSDLLSQTKSQEANFQKIIANKKAQEASFEDALNDLQSQLNVAVNQSEVTPGGSGIIHWPLDKVKITQFFGNTAFASSGAYNGKGHNGIDLGTPIGTPVKAALTGVVLGTGNTDAVKGCYSFGKWVFIKHPNGLGTIYGHLSQISVAAGQNVATGEVIGYSGETGYATGPHVHFGVYVAAATQIIKLGQATNQATPCATAVMPVAPLSGYLNPMNYLPTTGYTDVSG